MANKKATENILIVSFDTESKTYQAFSDLKQAAEDDNYFISQGSVVKKEHGEILVKDEFDTGLKAVDDTLKGGLIGGLVGLLGGPLGSLLGGSVGALIGDAKDTGEYMRDLTLLDTASKLVFEGETVLLLLADEKGDATLTEKLNSYGAKITRLSAAEVEKELELIAKAEDKRDRKALRDYNSIRESENLLIVNYENESDAYQALTELKALNDYYFIDQAAIVKKENGEYVVKEEYDSGVKTADDTVKGGLIGSLLGLLGGPVGVLLGGGAGAAIGGIKDTADFLKDFDLADYAFAHIGEGETVLLLLADEKGNAALNEKLNAFDVTIRRFSVSAVENELKRAAELQARREALEDEARFEELEAKRKELGVELYEE
jgi:uncharacterized membrane protein